MIFYVDYEIEERFSFDDKTIAQTIAKAVLEEEQCPYEVEINLLITDNEGIRQINREFRDIDKPTDVLSFPNVDFEKNSDFSLVEKSKVHYINPESNVLILGDIIISIDKVKEQADEYGHSKLREFAFLVAHSMLHLCGYDHEQEDEAMMMEQKQEAILQKLNITRD